MQKQHRNSLTLAKTVPKSYLTVTMRLFHSYISHICTKFCQYLTNISPIYHQNQGHVSVIWIWEIFENPDPHLKIVYILNCGLFDFFLFKKTFFGPKINFEDLSLTKKFLDQNFFSYKKVFLTGNFVFDQIFLLQFFLTQFLFWPKNFWTKFYWTSIFITKIILNKIFWTKVLF